MKTAYMQNKQITQFDHFVKTKMNEVETDVFMAQKGFEQYLATRNKPSRNKKFLWLFLLLLLLVPASFFFFFKNNGNSEPANDANTHTATGNIPAAVQPAPAGVSTGGRPGSENNSNTPKEAAAATPLENAAPQPNPLTGNKQVSPDTGTGITGAARDAASITNDKPALVKKDSARVKTIVPQKEDTLYIVW